MLEHLHTSNSTGTINQKHTKHEDMETNPTHESEISSAISTSLTPVSPLSMETNSINMPLESIHQEIQLTMSPQAVADDVQPRLKDPSPQKAQAQLQAEHTIPAPPSAPSRPLPLLVAKPYCQPRSTPPGHKPVKVQIHISWSDPSLHCIFTDA